MATARALAVAYTLVSLALLLFCGSLCVKASLIPLALGTIALLPIALYCKISTLTDKSLARDLDAIRHAIGPLYEQLIAKEFHQESVAQYYDATTERDYKLLEYFLGPGMHTCMYAAHPVGRQGGTTRQPALVLAELRACDAKKALEIGCGKGHCSLFLAGMCRDVAFHGIDLVYKNVQAAKADARIGDMPNATFDVGDATSMNTETRYGLIFGCESLCHMDTAEKAALFVKGVNAILLPKGRVVIIDGFTGELFSKCTQDQRRAMELAESGFSIKKMPSKIMWVELFAYAGMKLIRDVPLTHEALPFWTLGWRVQRGVFMLPWLARIIVSRLRRETATTLVSVAMTAHAMRSGAAEYGMLVFEKP